jgi:DNA-directed RNA polymerase subunit E'/Rpb7
MTELSTPYTDTELYSRILLRPQQINNDIYINLKNNLKKKVEKKCNKYGFITKVYKIVDYSDGEIIPENFDSSHVFNIKFSCRLCIPVINTKIICKIDLLNKALIKASNGPIVCIIGNNYINGDSFTTDNKGDIVVSQTNKILQINDHILITIRGTNFFPGDERIVILGTLEDIVSDKQVKEYYNENMDVEQIIDDTSENEKFNNSELESESNSDSDELLNNNYVNL